MLALECLDWNELQPVPLPTWQEFSHYLSFTVFTLFIPGLHAWLFCSSVPSRVQLPSLPAFPATEMTPDGELINGWFPSSELTPSHTDHRPSASQMFPLVLFLWDI